MDVILSVCILVLPCFCQGLFLDQMLSDCHGIPFMCQLKKKGEDDTASMNPFNAGTFPGSGSTNNMQSQPGVSNPGAMADHMGYNSGSNPADMTSVVTQDGIGAKNPFYEAQQHMMSGDLAVTMEQNISKQPSNNAATTAKGDGAGSGTMFGPGMVSGTNNQQKFGPGGISNNVGGMSSFPGAMTAQGGMGGGRFPGAGGMSGGFPGGSPGSGSGMEGFPGSGSGNGEKAKFGSTVATEQPKFAGDVRDGICEVTWSRCQQKCIIVDSETLCPVCSCKVDGELKNDDKNPDAKGSDGYNTRMYKTGSCPPYPPACPDRCVGFDEFGCTVCTCKMEVCEPFPNDCPRGFAMIDGRGCPKCRHDGAGDSSWYQGIWN